MKPGHRLGWKNLGGATNFASVLPSNPVADDLDNEIDASTPRSNRRALRHDPALFHPEHWHVSWKKIGGKPAIPILIGIWPLKQLQQGAAFEQ